MTSKGRSRAAALLVACSLILHSSCNDSSSSSSGSSSSSVEDLPTVISRNDDDRIYACLQNCANCVQFWASGLYNGRRCAKRCLRQQGREVVDPDCNDPKMFNYSPRIIDLLLEMQQTQRRGSSQTSSSDVTSSSSEGPVSMESRSATVVRLGGRKGGRNRKRAQVASVEGANEDPPTKNHLDGAVGGSSFRLEVEARHSRRRTGEGNGGGKDHGRSSRRPQKGHNDDEREREDDEAAGSPTVTGVVHSRRLTGGGVGERRRPQRRKLNT